MPNRTLLVSEMSHWLFAASSKGGKRGSVFNRHNVGSGGGESILAKVKEGTLSTQEGTVCSRPLAMGQAGRTEGPQDGTLCPSGKGVDPFKGAEATLGGTGCLPGGTGGPPEGTVCP